MTTKDMLAFKARVIIFTSMMTFRLKNVSLKTTFEYSNQDSNDTQVYLPSALEGDDEGTTQAIKSAMPFSIIGSTDLVNVAGKKVYGRQYIWGIAEVENESHCDFVKLRNLLIKFFLLILFVIQDRIWTICSGQLRLATKISGNLIVESIYKDHAYLLKVV